MFRATLRALLIPALLASSPVGAQGLRNSGGSATESADGTWRWLPTLPVGRYEHACDYDPVHDRMLIHGGWGGTSTLDDAWALSLDSLPDWDWIFPSGTAPRLRSTSHIYDPVRDRWILFGG